MELVNQAFAFMILTLTLKLHVRHLKLRRLKILTKKASLIESKIVLVNGVLGNPFTISVKDGKPTMEKVKK